MVKNIKCEPQNNASGVPVFQLKWEWIAERDSKLPSFRLLCCAIPEDELLKNSLFESDTISLYIRNEIKESGIDKCMQNPDRYKVINCALRPNGSIYYERDVLIDRLDCVYFFCMVDDAGLIFKYWTSKAESGNEVKYSAKTTGWGTSKKMEITLKQKDFRRIILKSEHGGSLTYSLLPGGYQKYYIPVIDNFDLIYLPALINV